MTVNQWIGENISIYLDKSVRMINKNTHKGYGQHWIMFKDREIDHVKITSKFIFIFV